MSAEQRVKEILSSVDVKVNGTNPWDIQVHNAHFYARVLSGGSLALGESYMDGWWDCEDITELIARLSRLQDIPVDVESLVMVLTYRLFSGFGKHSKTATHYDLSNELYESFLDSYMQYSAGLFEDDDTLDSAQEKKLALVCKALDLQKGDSVLDIGAGWGGFAKYATEKYGCHVTGVTLSREQKNYADTMCAGLGTTFLVADYQSVKGTFSKILVSEMLEHVGHVDYKKVAKKIYTVLAPEGKVFIQVTTGENRGRWGFDPWLHKYIFPYGAIPRTAQLVEAFSSLFSVTELDASKMDYEKTLLAWATNFERNWIFVRKGKFDERFYRMWKFYLLFCAGTFRGGINMTTQMILVKNV